MGFRDWLRNVKRRFHPKYVKARRIRYAHGPDGISLIQSRSSGAAYFFPYAAKSDFYVIQLFNLAHGFDEHLKQKYSCEAIHVRPGDTVIDCGGFVGGFSVAASKMGADRVLYVEPTPKTKRCAELNFHLHGCQNVSAFEMALGQELGTAKLNLSSSGSNNSLLAPDEDDLNAQIDVQVSTLEKLSHDQMIDPDRAFVKVEAEGFEVEIIRGLGGFRPRSIVVDVTPERGGKSPYKIIKDDLEALGYTNFVRTKRCLFAERP